MTYDLFGFILVSAAALLVVAIATTRPWPATLKRLLLAAVVLRIVGSFLRYEVLFQVYDGVGDATGYYTTGVSYASALYRLDFSIFESHNWWAGNWWGTQFIRYLSGFVIAIIGPTMRGEFLFFSLLAFAGLCLFGLAFHRAYPEGSLQRYVAWLWLWPSLWFWPSSVGKDAVLLLAAGLTAAGYVGFRERIRWRYLIPGLLLATAIRPHVAGVMVVVLALAQWLALGKRKMTLFRAIQGLVLVALAVFVVQGSLSQLGLEDADAEGIQEFLAKRTALATGGGSAIDTPAGGWAALPMAFVNILMRPFPWEAHNPQALGAALEIVVFWGMVWWRRRRIWTVLRHSWRADRFLRFALLMTGAYVLMIGLVFGNLGIIARQRIVVFPLLFVVLEAMPREVVALQRRRRQRRERALAVLRERRRRAAERPSGDLEPGYGEGSP